MHNYLEHPDEEILERFLLHRSDEEELEVVETHILACESCVSRLETLEIQIAATKLALQQIRQNEAAADAAPGTAARRAWFSLPKLSLAAGMAAAAVVILVVPHARKDIALPVAEVNLVANRGSETTAVPKDRPLHLLMNANDLNQKQLTVQLVDANGKVSWNGVTAIEQDRAAVNLPKIQDTGEHFVRLYAPGAEGEPELLREFAIDVE